MTTTYRVTGILCVRRLEWHQWETWLTSLTGAGHAIDVVREFESSPGDKCAYSWLSQVGKCRRMAVGETAHIAVNITVPYETYTDTYYGTSESDIIFDVKSKTLKTTRMSKRCIKREWYKL